MKCLVLLDSKVIHDPAFWPRRLSFMPVSQINLSPMTHYAMTHHQYNFAQCALVEIAAMCSHQLITPNQYKMRIITI